jgi:hypothetical protein
MISKCTLLLSAGGLICPAGTRPARATLPPISMMQHDGFMRLAIEEGRRNPAFPFGARLKSDITRAPLRILTVLKRAPGYLTTT